MRFNRNRDQHVEFCGTTLRTVSQHILPDLWNWRTSNGQLIVDYRNSNGPKKSCFLSIFRGNHDLYDLTKMTTLWRCVQRGKRHQPQGAPSSSGGAPAPRAAHDAMAEQLKFWRRCQTGSQQLTLCLRMESAQGSFPLRDLWQHERPTVYIYIYNNNKKNNNNNNNMIWYIYIYSYLSSHPHKMRFRPLHVIPFYVFLPRLLQGYLIWTGGPLDQWSFPDLDVGWNICLGPCCFYPSNNFCL